MRNRKDEFYTQPVDIENEPKHYREHFRGKTVLCNCDDPRVSNFFHYFSYNFKQLGLKKPITTCYKNQERDLFSQHDSQRTLWLEYNGGHNGNRLPDSEETGINYLQGDGDLHVFDENTRREVYERQQGHCANPECPHVGQHFEQERMESDRITSWSKDGRTVADNCQML